MSVITTFGCALFPWGLRVYWWWSVCAQLLQLCLTLCDPTDHCPPGFSVRVILRQEYWSGFPCPPPGDLPDPGIKPTPPMSPALQADIMREKLH